MNKKDILNKIFLNIVTRHKDEVDTDINFLVNSYTKDIYEELTDKFGTNLTDEIIDSEVDDYFNKLKRPSMSQGITQTDSISGNQLNVDNLMNCSNEDAYRIMMENLKDEEDSDDNFQVLMLKLFENIFSLDIDEDKLESLLSATNEFISFTTYNLIIQQELWDYIRGLYKDENEFRKVSNKIYSMIDTKMANSLHEAITEANNMVQEDISSKETNSHGNKHIKQSNSKVIEVDFGN